MSKTTCNRLGYLRLRPVTQSMLVALITAGLAASPALAQEPPAPPVSAVSAPAASPSPPNDKIELGAAPAATAKAAECACVPVEFPIPVFVDDPIRLAELTRSDPLVFEQADRLASRKSAGRNVAGAGVVLGLGTLGIGTMMRLHDAHWRAGNAATFISGGVLTIASILVAWAIWPDRDDRMDVINTWNQRHPQSVLWP